MKILAIATALVVFLSCLEVTLSYPTGAAKTEALPQTEDASIKMARIPREIFRAYLSDASAQQDNGTFS